MGRRCRSATIKDLAEELDLDWDTVKTLEKQYMQAQLAKAGTPGRKAIGIDETSIRKGHTYRIVVSDLVRSRPIWFGSEGRSEKSMAMFYDWLGEKKTRGIRLAVIWSQRFEGLEHEGRVRRPCVPEDCAHNAHLYYLLLPTLDERTALIRHLEAKDINAVFHYVPLHSSPAGQRFGRVGSPLPVTEDAWGRLLRLPLWIGVEEHQDQVVAEIERALG